MDWVSSGKQFQGFHRDSRVIDVHYSKVVIAGLGASPVLSGLCWLLLETFDSCNVVELFLVGQLSPMECVRIHVSALFH